MFILMIRDLYECFVTLVAFSTEEEAMEAFDKWEQGIPTGIAAVDRDSMRHFEGRTEGTVLNASAASEGKPEVLMEH